MKLSGKIVAILMCTVMFFSCTLFSLPASAAFDDGFDVMTTEKFYSILDSIDSFFYSAFGFHVFRQEKVEVEVDEELTKVCQYVNENCGLDPLLIASNLPSYTQDYLDVTRQYGIDIAELHARLNTISDKTYADGYVGLSYAVDFFAFLSAGVDKLTVICVPKSEKDMYELAVKVEYADGTDETMYSGICYDKAEQKLYGSSGHGILDIGYDFDIETLMVYVPINVWMRDYGFTSLYDFCAFITPFFNYTTLRMKFEYDSQDWMIQLWKGRYVIANGAEIGVYNKPLDRPGDFYDCVDDEHMLNMSMQLYHGDSLLLERGLTEHWWLSGFALSGKIYIPSSLTLKGTIALKDEEMLASFCEALDGYSQVSYTVDGLTVSFEW